MLVLIGLWFQVPQGNPNPKPIRTKTSGEEATCGDARMVQQQLLLLSHFVPSIWGRLHEPKENYVGSDTWFSFLHSFLSSNMPSLRPLASISCRIISIHVFFGLP